MLIDTQRESDIGLASRYKYPPMKDGECFVDQQMARNLMVEEGDVIFHRFDVKQNIIALVNDFNKHIGNTDYVVSNNNNDINA